MPSTNMWIYIKDCPAADAYDWFATFLNDLHLTYHDGDTQIFDGKDHCCVETIVLTQGINERYLEVICGNCQGRWKTNAEFAQEAFHVLNREIRWAPEQQHYPGEVFVIDETGQRLVDWDEEIEQQNDDSAKPVR